MSIVFLGKKYERMPSKPATKDPEMGCRFSEICEKLFPGMSRSAIARELGTGEKNIRTYENGTDINCKVLAAIAKHDGDVVYILTGRTTRQREEKRRESVEAITSTICGLLRMQAQIMRGKKLDEYSASIMEIARQFQEKLTGEANAAPCPWTGKSPPSAIRAHAGR